MKQIEISPRQFKGELPDMKQPKEVRRFNQAHLKAYLKGKRKFAFGIEKKPWGDEPIYYSVKVIDRVLSKN